MIYIQSNKEITRPLIFDSSCALYGALESGLDYRLTTFEEVASGKFDALIRTNVFVGSVEFMREVFSRIGLTDVRVPKNSNRESQIMELGEAYQLALSKKIFIKPVEIKLFTGLVLDGSVYSQLNFVPENSLVMVYDVFPHPIESEWRIYVLDGKIMDSRNYSGDFMVTPDYSYVLNDIRTNRDEFPCSYTIDVGILSNGESVIIEYNDMWAIGNYGVPNDIYVRMLKNRYFEIVRR
jgi:hypothetical protein